MSFKVAVFSLNQWALDFSGNKRRIIESIRLANEHNATYRVGPELELCGYSLEDAFYEQDTVFHSWSCLMDIIEFSKELNIIVDVGMPVHNGALYNCRVITYRGRILCIRAKSSLAKEGLYREYRHFMAWNSGLVSYKLPAFVANRLSQNYVPFGADFILELEYSKRAGSTFKIGWEICQELWDIENVSSRLFHNFGCHLVVNSSGSYWELRKLNTIMDMIKGISLRAGACYAYSNLVGCDGQRFVFYGRSCIYDKGERVAMTPTSKDIFKEIQMVTHVISVRDIEEYRSQMGITIRNNEAELVDLLKSDLSKLSSSNSRLYLDISEHGNENTIDPHSNDFSTLPDLNMGFELEIHRYVSLWLWDYLRRSGMKGFMMPLSGGLDSSTVAVLVYSMSKLLYENQNLTEVKSYFENVHQCSTFKSPGDICSKILKCTYLSTKFSSEATNRRARLLAKAVGAEFIDISLQNTYTDLRNTLDENATEEVSLLDQNLQARLRMTATYYLSGGSRIVLATGNVDEAIMGYLTKYDCSSADINPIGGLCKDDLKSYLRFCQREFQSNIGLVEMLEEIIQAPPSAELTGAEQRDEDEIGITYDEISVLGRVRRGIYACSGPRGAFETVWLNKSREPFCSKIRCLRSGSTIEKATSLAELIKRFYQRYARNRHKLTVLTPALHAETYSPDDNRFDHRHFLYAPWTEQFQEIDNLVQDIRSKSL